MPVLVARGVVSPSPATEDSLIGELISILACPAWLPARTGDEDGNINGDDDGTAFSFWSRLDARGVACVFA
jgi:hypothetical protein